MLAGRRDSTSGAHVSVWTRSAETPKFPVLGHDIRVDVAVVGAGITGLSVAYEVAKRGLSVAVVDDGAIGSGESGRTTAHLASAVDDHYHVLAAIHGAEAARHVAASHSAAIDRIEAIAAAEGIACGFERVDGWLFSGPGEADEDGGTILREYRAAREAGLAVFLAERAPIPGMDTGAALRFPDQAQFHPLRYLAGLAEAAVRHGAAIYVGHATEIDGGRDAGVTLHSGRRISAGSVVVATNVPVNDRLAMHTKLEPHRTYVVALDIPPGGAPRALLWDTGDPYHYVRVAQGAGDGDLLLVGGEDHPVGQADDYDRRYADLEAWARVRFPSAGEVRGRWSGQIIETLDGLAYIGRNPGADDNVYIATGDSGNGLTHGVIASLILPDLIQGREHPWAETYRPGRLPAKATGEMTRHNLKTAARYAGWVRGAPIAEERALEPGQGALIRHGLRPVAVYRDMDGAFHHMSAICPHLKCIVNWNSSEQTWDCPCHGSRFDRRGVVINGPANRNLARLDEPEPHPVFPAGPGTGESERRAP